MSSKKTEEECSQELNMRMRVDIGYREEDHDQHLMSKSPIALDETKKFKVIFDSNFIAMRWEQRI